MNALAILIIVTAFAANPLLLSTAEVADKDQNITVVDARPLDDYTSAHVPGAKHVDASALSETRDGVRGLLKPVEEVTQALAQAGISRDKPVVVYGSMKDAGSFTAVTRLFWILELLAFENVALMDGGMEKWIAENRPTQSGATQAKPVELDLKFRPELLATKRDVSAASSSGAVLLDNRSPEQYRGDAKESYIDRAGHIPGAINLPAGQCLSGESTLKSWEELQALMKNAGASEDKKLITYCNSGRSASVGYFVARLLGNQNVAMYDGSMAEWGNDTALAIESGSSRKN